MASHLWKLAEEKADNDKFSSELIDSVHVGKIYQWWDGRNAWHSTWIERYDSLVSFCISEEMAKSHIEANRVQGSIFYLQEFPVLTFIGKHVCLLVGEISSAPPLSAYKTKNFTNVRTLGDAAKLLNLTGDSRTIRIFSSFFPKKLDRTARYPGMQSVGGGSELDYVVAKKIDVDARDLYDVCDSAKAAIQEAIERETLEKALAALKKKEW